MTVIDYIKRYWKYAVLGVALMIICGGAAAAYAWGVLPNEYKATGKFVTKTPEAANYAKEISENGGMRSSALKSAGAESSNYKCGSEVASNVVTIWVSGPNAQVCADAVNIEMKAVKEKADPLIYDAATGETVTIVASATTPKTSTGPNRTMMLAGGLFAGLFLAICIAIAAESLKRRKQTLESIEQLLHLNGIAQYPSEANNLVSCIQQSSIDTAVKSIAVVGATRKEKASDVAAFLAYELARTEAKTLIVKPSAESNGLYALASKQAGLQQVCKSTGQAHPDELSMETSVSNWGAVFASHGFAETLESQLKTGYEHIVFDAPAFSPVPNALPLAHTCDATIIVVNRLQSDTKLLQKMTESLKGANANILGVVLTK